MTGNIEANRGSEQGEGCFNGSEAAFPDSGI